MNTNTHFKSAFITVAVSTALLALTGCKANPFPEDGRQKLETPPIVPQEVPSFTIVDPPLIETVEGDRTNVPISVRSTLPGTLSLQLLNATTLPSWISFNPATSQLSLNPDYEAATDPREIRRTSRTYELKFKVRSSESELIGSERTVRLEVKDTPRSFVLTPSIANPAVAEGNLVSLQLTVQDQDFPRGPFQLLIEGLPVSATFAPGTVPGVYTVQYTPPFNTVLRTDPTFPSKQTNMRILVVNPRGRELAQSLTLTVNDVRKAVVFSGPTDLRGNTSVGTQIRVDDPNGEGAPELAVLQSPNFGVFAPLRLEQTNDGTNGLPAFSVYSVSWLDIPPNRLGSVANFEVRGCNFSNATAARNNCLSRTYTVRLEGTPAQTPGITRVSWPIGETRYVKVGQTVATPIRIVDRDATPRALTATATALRGGITAALGLDNAELRITGTTVGPALAQVSATSSMGMTSTEVFFVEVLPANWANHVIVASGFGDSETAHYANLIASSAVVSNTTETRFLEYLMALKRGAAVGTSGISNASAMAIFMAARQQFTSWFLASPIVGNIPASLKTELEAAGLVFGPRMTLGTEVNRTLIGTQAGVAAGITIPVGISADLRGAAATENARVQTFSVRPGTAACAPLFQVSSVPGSRATGTQMLAMRCMLGTRTVFVSGFDYSDLVFSGETAANSTVRAWYARMLPVP